MRSYMIEVYKIMHGVDKVDQKKLFSPFQDNRANGHPMKLTMEFAITRCGASFQLDWLQEKGWASTWMSWDSMAINLVTNYVDHLLRDKWTSWQSL